jgi:proteasome lid subunit RPN8/RPN11
MSFPSMFQSPLSAITSLAIAPDFAQQLSQQYDRDSHLFEKGGILCGSRAGATAQIHRILWVNSTVPDAHAYLFDPRILTFGHQLCGENELIGVLHTHPSGAPEPSAQDRHISESTNTVGCVLTHQLLCFFGDRDLPVAP